MYIQKKKKITLIKNINDVLKQTVGKLWRREGY